MTTSPENTSQEYASGKVIVAFLWMLSLVFVGFVGFAYGKESAKTPSKADEKVLSAKSQQENTLQQPISFSDQEVPEAKENSTALPAPESAGVADPNQNTNKTCERTGLAQKWEYLTPYVMKANDSLQSVAKDTLKDASRVNELVQINGIGPFVVGSTVYLPPDSIKKSSGKIQQIYGKLVEKNEASWHVSFTSDKNGQGLLIPSFLFDSVANKNEFQIGDCIAVLFDDGYKVYTIAMQ